MRIEQVMTRDVVTVSPEMPLKDVAALLAEHEISGIPVCEGGHVVGVVSENDILFKELGGEDERHGGPLARLFDSTPATVILKEIARSAGEAMTTPAITIGPRQPVSEAARIMVDRGVNRLPVVENGELVGLVTRADLVRAFVRSDEEIAREIEEDVIVRTLWISPERITVGVLHGEVTLTGGVDNRSEAELVTAFVRRVPGVVSVASDVSWKLDDLERRRGEARIPKRI